VIVDDEHRRAHAPILADAHASGIRAGHGPRAVRARSRAL
jgi:hypothetical protein